MDGSRTVDAKLHEVLDRLASLKGVHHAFYLTEGMRAEVRRLEKENAGRGPIAVHNEGVLECLKRGHVACIVKDKSFRPPPHPTVVLRDDHGKVIGKELLPGQKAEHLPGKKVLMLGKDFVVYYDGNRAPNAKFVLPGIPFKEVAEIGGTSEVLSSSPSSLADLYIKRSAGLPDDPKLASVLVGFDI